MTERADRRGTNSQRLLRVLDILRETDESHPLTQNEIVDRLDRLYDIDAEKKAVGRDIQALNDCGYCIEQCTDNKLGCYFVGDFEDWELKIMMDAVRSAKFLDEASTDNLVKKIRSLASADSQRTLNLMNIPADVKIGDRTTKIVIDTVLKAMRTHRKIKFDYLHLDRNGKRVSKFPEGTKPVSPYALVWRDDRYFLIGSYMDDALSYYRMDRIFNIRETEERAVPLQDILGSNAEQKLNTFVKQNIYNRKGEEIRLELRLLKNGVDTVIDSFGNDVRVVANKDGTLSAFVTVTDSEGLYAWLLQHGRNVTVVSPKPVKKEMKRRLKKMLENYKED